MKTEKPLAVKGIDSRKINPEFIEARLAPLLDQLCDLIESEFPQTGLFHKTDPDKERMGFIDKILTVVKEESRRNALRTPFYHATDPENVWPNRSGFRKWFQEVFLTSSEPTVELYKELLAMELVVKEEIELKNKKQEEEDVVKSRAERIIGDSKE